MCLCFCCCSFVEFATICWQAVNGELVCIVIHWQLTCTHFRFDLCVFLFVRKVMCSQAPFLFFHLSFFFCFSFSLVSILLISCQIILYGLKREHVYALGLWPVTSIFILWKSYRSCDLFLYFFFCFKHFTGQTDIGGLKSDENWHFSKKLTEKKESTIGTRESVNFEWYCTSIFSFIYFFIFSSLFLPPVSCHRPIWTCF